MRCSAQVGSGRHELKLDAVGIFAEEGVDVLASCVRVPVRVEDGHATGAHPFRWTFHGYPLQEVAA